MTRFALDFAQALPLFQQGEDAVLLLECQRIHGEYSSVHCTAPCRPWPFLMLNWFKST